MKNEDWDKMEEELKFLTKRVEMLENRKPLICEKCSEIFKTAELAGEHAMKEKHYTFKLQGTTLCLGFV